jgi:L-ascorbate metabolism protein UlaG (beta-lactamase superfamily)
MLSPIQRGPELIREIDLAESIRPRLWWLGHSGFVIKYYDIVFYLDPFLSHAGSPLNPAMVDHADMILCSHAHAPHLDPHSVPAILQASQRAKVVIPKSVAQHARSIGIDYDRMTTTDADLRVEYFKNGMYARVYAVPSAHPQLDYTPLGGYPYLGYLVRCGGITIYHAGDCVPYESLVQRLKPYNVTVALLPISGPNFTVEEAAELATAIGAQWLIPMHYHDEQPVTQFVNQMLFFRPSQRFKTFQCGEGWQVPAAEE